VLIIALERFATPTQSSVINIQATFSHVISKGILKPVKGAQALEEDVKVRTKFMRSHRSSG
jgi:hypothetical protein